MLYHSQVKLCKNTKQNFLRGTEVAHTLWAWLRDYIKLQIILTVQGIVGVKHDKYCFLVTETVMSEGGNTRGPVQWKTQSMQAVALQYTSRTAVFSWAASWLQLEVRAPPIPGSVSWNILETKGLWNERKGVPQFFLTPSSCRSHRGQWRVERNWKPLPHRKREKLYAAAVVRLHGCKGWERNWMWEDEHQHKQAEKVHVWTCLHKESTAVNLGQVCKSPSCQRFPLEFKLDYL